MKKNKEENLKFREWFRQNWLISGGLIPKATAARLLNKSKSRITQMIKEGKLVEHKFNDSFSYIEAPQIFRIMHKEDFELIIDTLYKEAEVLPETHQQSFLDAMIPAIEEQKNSIEPTKENP